QVSARLADLELADGQVTGASGRITLGDAHWLLADPALLLGAFEARIETTAEGDIRAHLSEQADSPLRLRGTATLSPSGHWRLDARLRARPGSDIADQLVAFGRPGAEGWYRIRQSGDL